MEGGTPYTKRSAVTYCPRIYNVVRAVRCGR